MKTLDLNILKCGFHEVDWVGKDRSNHIQLDNSKVRLLEMGKELMTKMTKSNKGWRECSQKLMSLSPIFSMPIFSSTEFSILRISCGSDNVKVASVKTHLRGFLCVCYSCITRSKATFCQRGLLLPVYLCVKVNVKIAGNSCFWPFVLKQPCIYIYIYINLLLISDSYQDLSFFIFLVF